MSRQFLKLHPQPGFGIVGGDQVGPDANQGLPLEAEQVAKQGIFAEASVIEDLHFFLGKLHRSNGEVAKAYESFQIVLMGYEDEDAEAALTDLEQAARVKGIKLPKVYASSDDNDDDSETDEEHVPGEMIANVQQKSLRKFFQAKQKLSTAQ